MPTENRSSNNEQMVSVPRELLERCDFGKNTAVAMAALPELCALLAQPAAQHQGEQFTYSSKQATNCAGCGTRKHTPLRVDGMGGYVCLTCIDQKLESLLSPQEHQGEPVAVLYANGAVLTKAECGDVFDICCKVETPLYTHADPGEVERLRKGISKHWKVVCDQRAELDTLRAQLAKLDALFSRVIDHLNFWHDHPYAECLHGVVEDYRKLSASAEPAPTSDGFSAGDMADQGAKAFRDGQRALVLPDREQYTKYLSGVIPNNAAEVNGYKDGWNACLDEVQRLNEAAIAPE